MRVIAGALGGRQFESPRAQRTHPMADKVRGALFNTLGDIEGLTILDAFSGSGALGFESVSRGAASVVSIENDRLAQRSIADAMQQLGVGDHMRLVKAGAATWSDNNTERQFDLVMADPPFDDLQLATLRKLTQHVTAGGLFIVCWPGKADIPEFDGLQIADHRSYGDAQLIFYRS